MDISPDDHRAVSYTTTPFIKALDILGTPEGDIGLSADQPDFPLSVWLSDVSPNGFATLICQGWTRPTHSTGRPFQTDRVERVRVALSPTAYRLPAGQRVRVVVSGADFPKLVPAPANPHLTLWRSPAHPSRLRLPVADVRTVSRRMFDAPTSHRPAALLRNTVDHSINRDLLDRRASHSRVQHAEYMSNKARC
jgi:predicted acyl esterase